MPRAANFTSMPLAQLAHGNGPFATAMTKLTRQSIGEKLTYWTHEAGLAIISMCSAFISQLFLVRVVDLDGGIMGPV